MKRILVLEDEPAIADTLLYPLRSDGYTVQHVGLVQDAIKCFEEQAPDLAILDIGLPDGSGLDVCRHIRRSSNLPILFLSARSDEIDRIVGLELGADDYVAKPFSPREVCARVRAILRRAQGASTDAPTKPSEPHPETATPPPETPQQQRLHFDVHSQRVVLAGKALDLTRYEHLLLATLIKRPARIFSRTELMELVWSDAYANNERTVDAHIKMLRAKLRAQGLSAQPDDGPEVIQTHRNMGYSFNPYWLAPSAS